MRQPIPLTDEMIEEIIRLREKGIGLRPIGKRLGVSHQTISNWLNSNLVTRRYSDVTGFAVGDHATLKGNTKSGEYQLQSGEDVVIEEFDPANNIAWVSSYRLPSDVIVDVPLNALNLDK